MTLLQKATILWQSTPDFLQARAEREEVEKKAKAEREAAGSKAAVEREAREKLEREKRLAKRQNPSASVMPKRLQRKLLLRLIARSWRHLFCFCAGCPCLR